MFTTHVHVSNLTRPGVSAAYASLRWGWGDFGRLGHGDPRNHLAPAPVAALSGVAVRHVACGDSHCLVVAHEGKLFAFGRNQNGQLGLGDTQDRLTPELVGGLWDEGVLVRRAAGGAEHSAVTAEGGAMYTFGWGRYGNLGHGRG
jgi:alpha-tubulin suppressor-like RCC1 family protein